jgi:hypothetical protein
MIPYLDATFSKRTQIIETRLYLTPVTITLATATDFTTVTTLTLGAYQGFANLVGTYGEYRAIRGELYYTPNSRLVPTTSGGAYQPVPLGLAVIDYANSAGIASFAVGMKADTKKIFYPNSEPSQKVVEPGCVQRWSIRLDQLPDQEWIANSVTNTAFCYWKPFIPANATTGAAAGILWGWMDFQFRGSAAI